MRHLIGVLCGLGVVIVSQAGLGREARDYEADERSITDCVEAAERSRSAVSADLIRQCIGQQTQICDRVTQDAYQSNKRMYCADAEAEVWRRLLGRAYASLLEALTKADDDARKMTTLTYESAADALKQAHEAWKATDKDCEFARIQARFGTDRYDVPARCERDRIAERALLYRRWLVGQPY
ncbi:hypothetical protein BH11PSE3_BH11PSE3_21200 [soil metagenome]